MRSLVMLAALAVLAGCEPADNSNSAANSPNITQNISSPSPIAAASSTPEESPSPAPALRPLQPDPQGVQAAIDVVHEYYAAINARDYRKAYELWSGKGEASKQTFEDFRDGFANTEDVEIDTSGEPGTPEGAAGSQYIKIPLLIKARMKDGKVQNFWGEYTMRRSMVDGATADQRAWRIYSAEVKKL